MKILYISNGSNFLSAGGMEYHLLDITNWLEEKGAETALAVRKGTYIHRNLLHDRANVYPLSSTGFNKFLAFFQMAKAIRDFSPDIISINRERDIIRVFFVAKCMNLFLKKKPKIVSVFHNVGWKGPFIMEKLDGLIFPNNYIKQGCFPPGVRRENKSAVIYHGVHLPKVDPKDKLNPNRPRKYFKGVGSPLIGMVGELRKNQSELVDVAYHLKKKISDFTMAIVGRGTEEEIRSLNEKIDRMGLSKNFIITGGVDRKHMPDIFYDLDISVSTNRREPFGIVFIESFASYTPLIAYNSGGPVEIVEKGGGLLVKVGPEEMAEKIFMLLSDHELRISLGMAGREAAEKYFSVDSMGEQHYNFYLSILEDSFSKSSRFA